MTSKGYKIVAIGDKHKSAKTKNDSRTILELYYAKMALETIHSRKMTRFWKVAKMAILQTLYSKAKWSKRVSFGDEHKSAKNTGKTTLETHQSCSMQKNDPKKRFIFEKWNDFEKKPKWPFCKGYI